MFKLFSKNKNIDTQEVKAFDSAVKAIDIYIALSEWAKARKAVEEILYKEKESLNEYLEKISQENDELISKKLKEKEKKDFSKKEKIIEKLKTKIEKQEAIYIKKIEKERFKIRFKKIKDEVSQLVWKKRSVEALSLLKKFLEENKEKSIVINFYNTEKKKIQSNIEKQRKAEQEKLKSNARIDALQLIWETVKINDDEKEVKEKKSIFKKFNVYKNIKDKIKKKKLLDEINLLIEEDSRVNDEIAEEKLENIHKWLTKEINKTDMVGYDLYWKILWVTKISWDTFWVEETNEKYNFFIWDATWSWIKAWFIVTMINKLFKENNKKPLNEIVTNVNNWLKQDLQSRNFITWIFFEVEKKSNDLWYVWMWHEPMLVYRKKTKSIEKIIVWWLAIWIRLIDSPENIKVKYLNLEDWDIVLTYSDWVIESKNIDWENYWIDKLIENFKLVAENEWTTKSIYEYIINDIKLFRWGTDFEDDATLVLFKRDATKDLINEEDQYLKEIKANEWLAWKDLKKLKWKTKIEIEKELEKIRREKETTRIIKSLENLYYTWEILKLKEESIRFIKEWYIDKKINYYLRKAIDNEKKYKIEQKNKKMIIKYNILTELYKKWDYATVIRETEDIIAKDWNI